MIFSGLMLGILKALPSHIWTSTAINALAFSLGFNWSVGPNVRMFELNIQQSSPKSHTCSIYMHLTGTIEDLL